MPASTHAPPPDISPWHQLTDEYAAALYAMERGEPTARERVQRLYAQVRQGLMAGATGLATPHRTT